MSMLLQYVPDGALPPRWYGVAWYDYTLHVRVCAPVPLNWLLGWGRLAWYTLASGPRQRLEDRIYKASNDWDARRYSDAFDRGLQMGLAQGRREGKDEFLEVFAGVVTPRSKP